MRAAPGGREARGSAANLDAPAFVEAALPFVQVCDEQQVRAAPQKCARPPPAARSRAAARPALAR
jgi:hypothetical protein